MRTSEFSVHPDSKNHGVLIELWFSMTISQTRNVGLPLMKLVRWKGVPILQQLHLEEQLLRTSSENWCIINDGTNDPTIVMGISGFKRVFASSFGTPLDSL